MNDDDYNMVHGQSVTAGSLNAQNTSSASIAVIPEGTTVPLPDDQILNGFTVNAANTIFTVTAAGAYLITYSVKITAALPMASRILLNGAPMSGTIHAPEGAAGEFTAARVNTLAAGDTIQLQLYGLPAAAVLQADAGASLHIIRLL